MKISQYQRSLMNHTISGPNRNWFGTSKDCKDGLEFEKLVSLGLAISETPPNWFGDEIIYRLTAKGKRSI